MSAVGVDLLITGTFVGTLLGYFAGVLPEIVIVISGMGATVFYALQIYDRFAKRCDCDKE